MKFLAQIYSIIPMAKHSNSGRAPRLYAMFLAAAISAALVMLALTGCGNSGSASTGTTSTGRAGTQASGFRPLAAQVASVAASQAAAQEAGASVVTGQADQQGGIELKLLGLSLRGSQNMVTEVARGQQITFWVKTTGPAASVIVNIRPSDGGMGQNVDLVKSGEENGVTVWKADTSAPSDPGRYDCGANVFDAGGKAAVNGQASVQVD